MSLRPLHPDLDAFLRVFRRLRGLCKADADALSGAGLRAEAAALWAALDADFGPVAAYYAGRKAALRPLRQRAEEELGARGPPSPKALRDAVALRTRLEAQAADREFFAGYLATPGAEERVRRFAALERGADAWYASQYRGALPPRAREACAAGGARLSLSLGREEYVLALAVRRAASLVRELGAGLAGPGERGGGAGEPGGGARAEPPVSPAAPGPAGADPGATGPLPPAPAQARPDPPAPAAGGPPPR